MTAIAIHEGKVCPFTLELYKSCFFLERIHEQNLCPYTLEACLLIPTEGNRVHLKLKTDNRQVPSE